MYQNKFMTHYRIEKPTVVSTFIQSYCTARFRVRHIITSNPDLVIPYRCNVFPLAYIILERIDTINYDLTTHMYFKGVFEIFIKFIIDSVIPTINVSATITSYGCVGACYDLSNTSDLKANMHVTICIINWVISGIR